MKASRLQMVSKMQLFSVLTVMAIVGSVIAADWPVWRGPDHNGFSKETDWKVWGQDGPKVLWKDNVGMGFSTFVAAGDKVITMGNDGNKNKSNASDTVYCFDVTSGKSIWTHKYPCPLEPKYYSGGTLATPTIDGDKVYTLSKMGLAFCLNLADGKPVWQRDFAKDGYELPTWHFSGSPLIIGDVIYLNIGASGVALNKKTGKDVWTSGKGACGYATVVPFTMNGQSALAIAGMDQVFAVNPADGKVIWQFEWKTKNDVNAAAPIIFDNYVFISSGYNRGCGLFQINNNVATKVYDNKTMRNHMNSSVLYNGYLYGFDENQFKCVKAIDNTEAWSDKSMGKGAVMMCTDGRLILTSDKSELIIAQADPAGYKELARAQILPSKNCWTVPVLANGKIFIRNEVGDIACVDVSK